MIKRKREVVPAVYLRSIEERRMTHAGCPMCRGRKVVATVINGVVCVRPCEWFGCGGRAREHGGFWHAVKGWPATAGGAG